LPADSLNEAQRLADVKNVNLSTIITEAPNEGLRVQARAERSAEVIEGYRKAFSGFSEEELSILDGIDPAIGPFLFDTSAERWFNSTERPNALAWMVAHLFYHEVHVSAVTEIERVLGVQSPLAPHRSWQKGAR
jgi:hypothetical protein